MAGRRNTANNGSTWPNCAAQTRGWQTGLFSLYGRMVVKKYKTFLATYKPVGGVIRVVLVREVESWVAYFSTDPDLSVAAILEAVADRSALEQVFHDVKEVHGAGQQQLRHVWANVGAWNLIGWWHTLVELWAWNRPHARLRDRSDSPWDKPERRPSHANRCQELRREALQEEYSSLPSRARAVHCFKMPSLAKSPPTCDAFRRSASAMLVTPMVRSKPIVAFRKAAITSGPERLRIRLASSPIVTSRT